MNIEIQSFIASLLDGNRPDCLEIMLLETAINLLKMRSEMLKYRAKDAENIKVYEPATHVNAYPYSDSDFTPELASDEQKIRNYIYDLSAHSGKNDAEIALKNGLSADDVFAFLESPTARIYDVQKSFSERKGALDKWVFTIRD